MDLDAFWQLIATIDVEALRSGEEENSLEPLIKALAERGEKDIQSFEDTFAQMLYDIDGQIYADNAGESGGSGDGFLYVRCCVVALGKTFYEDVKANPNKMLAENEWCESMLHVTQKAWARATGNEEGEWDYHSSVDYETGSNKSAW